MTDDKIPNKVIISKAKNAEIPKKVTNNEANNAESTKEEFYSPRLSICLTAAEEELEKGVIVKENDG